MGDLLNMLGGGGGGSVGAGSAFGTAGSPNRGLPTLPARTMMPARKQPAQNPMMTMSE